MTREHGKTLGEAKASVQRGVEMVEFACGIPSLIMGQTLPNLAANVDCETVRHPVGVCVGITPFNFPAMVPLWMFPVALVCGNTFILKPSEKVPLSAVKLGELLVEAGLPPGVFNIIHGDRECVEALLNHPLVRAVSFVGSTAVARQVYETGTRQRQTRAGCRRRQEPPHHHAGRRPRPGRQGHPGGRIRLRRRALHGRQRGGSRRRHRRSAGGFAV